MIPGEVFPADGEIELNAGRATVTLTVANTGDRPIQVGSHYHFYETNPALNFDRETGARLPARHRRRHRRALRARPDARRPARRRRRRPHGLRLPPGDHGKACDAMQHGVDSFCAGSLHGNARI